MLLAYGDESMDETNKRVCAMVGVVGTTEEWSALERKWLERTCGIPFHANDCESDYGSYRETLTNSHKDNQTLYKDLTVMLAESGLYGYGSTVDLVAQCRVFPSPPFFHQTYYRCFVDVLEAMKNYAARREEIAELTFDSRMETEHNAALIYASLRELNPNWRERLASKVSFESSASNPRIQVADLFAREAMKALDNLVGPVKRDIRKSWKALQDTGRFTVFSFSEDWFNDLHNDLPNLQKRHGFDIGEYPNWLKEQGRQHNMTSYIEFIDQFWKSQRPR